MKLSIHQQVRRRDLMKMLGTAALALPVLELFESKGRAQAPVKKSKYAVFCYTPDGVNQGAFWPTGGATDFKLSRILTPFEPYRDKLLVLGPQMNGTNVANGTGLAYIAGTPQHEAPVTLAARVGRNNGMPGLPYLDQLSAVNKVDGPSIDQVIANAVKGDSSFGSLNFGLHPIGGDTPSDINFQVDGTSIKRLSSADEAWNYVFGNPVMSGATSSISAINKHTAVSDFLHARFGALLPTLSAADRLTLDGHLTALKTYEDRVKTRLQATGQGSAACTSPKRAMVVSDSDAVRTGADTETLCPFYMDLIATAFSCNLTKVASVTFGYPGGGDAGGLRMPWLGFTDPMHFVSHHGGNPTQLDKYAQMSTWIASQIAGLMQRLAALPSASGSGTVLDETTIYWFNRHGDGDSHSNHALPGVLLGGTGGYFNMGRVLALPPTNPTQVLISIANAMGVDVPRFGEQAFEATSPLNGLTS